MNGGSVVHTSAVYKTIMLVLLMTGNCKVLRWVHVQWHAFHTDFQENRTTKTRTFDVRFLYNENLDLKMEAARSSKKLVSYNTTRHHNPEDPYLEIQPCMHRFEKEQLVLWLWNVRNDFFSRTIVTFLSFPKQANWKLKKEKITSKASPPHLSSAEQNDAITSFWGDTG
jgi:hypothetical protein